MAAAAAASSSSRKRRLDLDDDVSTTSASKLPSLNPLTGKPFSRKYFELREQRQRLPVWQYLDELDGKLRAHQSIIVEGETGSGKTTQVRVCIVVRSKTRCIGCGFDC